MQVPARLKWRVEQGRFAAYPLGDERQDRVAIVQYQSHRPTGTQWLWSVWWPGWFSDDGVAADKQTAADRATEACWRLVVTQQPRDIDAELDVILARILVMPPPNSLLTESTEHPAHSFASTGSYRGTKITLGATAPLSFRQMR